MSSYHIGDARVIVLVVPVRVATAWFGLRISSPVLRVKGREETGPTHFASVWYRFSAEGIFPGPWAPGRCRPSCHGDHSFLLRNREPLLRFGELLGDLLIRLTESLEVRVSKETWCRRKGIHRSRIHRRLSAETNPLGSVDPLIEDTTIGAEIGVICVLVIVILHLGDARFFCGDVTANFRAF